MFRTLTLTLALLAAATPAAAQFETGSILGTITDPSGGVIDGALVSGIQQDFRGANNYRPNVRAPNGNRSSAAFGSITQTYDPRQLQCGVKVNF